MTVVTIVCTRDISLELIPHAACYVFGIRYAVTATDSRFLPRTSDSVSVTQDWYCSRYDPFKLLFYIKGH